MILSLSSCTKKPVHIENHKPDYTDIYVDCISGFVKYFEPFPEEYALKIDNWCDDYAYQNSNPN